MTRLEPVHPGEIPKHDFMEPFALSSTALARAIGVTLARINEIVRCRRGITAETALRLARYFNTDAQSWMNLQDRYELTLAERDAKHYYHDPVVMHGNRESLCFHFFASFLHLLHDGSIDEYEECDPRALCRAEGVIGNIGGSEALAA